MRPTHSLNGLWTSYSDPDDTGISQRWPEQPPNAAPPVGKGRISWHFCAFDLAPEFLHRATEIFLTVAHPSSTLWLNGTRLVGASESQGVFRCPTMGQLAEGKNIVALRVAADGDAWSPNGGDSGIDCVDERRLLDVFIQPDLRRKRLTITTTASVDGAIHAAIAGTAYATEQTTGKFLLEFPEFEPWTPDNPQLYDLHLSLIVDGETVDARTVRFGMREFTVRDQRFYLNNHPIYLRGTVSPPLPAHEYMSPDLAAQLKTELNIAKAAGFNLIRFTGAPASPLALDLCDALGLLVWQEVQALDTDGTPLPVLRDRNHPSVVIWDWHGAQTPDGIASADPSRVIFGGDGGSSWVMRPYHGSPEPCDALPIHLRAPVDADIENYFRYNGTAGRLVALRSFGVTAIEDLASAEKALPDGSAEQTRTAEANLVVSERFAARELDRGFGDFSAFARGTQDVQTDAARMQIDALRGNDKVGGYCFGQLRDGGAGFGSGIVDRARRPKPLASVLKQIQQPIRPLIVMPKTTLVPREEANVTIVLANDARIEGLGEISLQVVGPTNQVLWKKKRGIKIARNRREIWSGKIGASGSIGPHKFVVRVLQNMKVIAQNSIDIHVLPPVEPCAVGTHVVDPGGTWRKRCAPLCKMAKDDALVHVVPPLSNTVRGYPAKELARVLSLAYEGAVAVICAPPADWNDLAKQVDEDINATSRPAWGNAPGVFHHVRLHPLFEGLPSRCIMRQVYRNIVPPRAFLERSDEDICGYFDAGALQSDGPLWGDDILVRRYGSGRLVFTHLRIMEYLGQDPAADRLFVNLLTHFARRSVPSEEAVSGNSALEQWLVREQDNCRRWRVLGMFPNWAGSGHDTVLPPEEAIEPGATYAGWYRPIEWRDWWTRGENRHQFSLAEAFMPVYHDPPGPDYGTCYAYAEFAAERRQDVTLQLAFDAPVKAWFNSRLVFEGQPENGMTREAIESAVRQGKNTVLLKISKGPEPYDLGFDIASRTREPLRISWWK